MLTSSLAPLTFKVKKVLKALASNPSTARYQRHTLHYVLTGLGQLPTPILERFNQLINAPNAEQYPHADAHLRAILAVSNKLKHPLTLDNLLKLRHKFAANAVSLQDPRVWQQASSDDTDSGVSWQDKTIANADGGDMRVRCYQESARQQAADETVMLFFHGGGFCIGDLDTHQEICHQICAQTGWAVVSVDYRLAPEHPAPAAVQDCVAAYAWLADNAQSLGAQASRIVLSGDSAGGCLAILTAQLVTNPIEALWQDKGEEVKRSVQNLPRPLAQLPLYPVTDYESRYPSWEQYGKGLLLDSTEAEVFNSAYVKQSDLPQSHPLVSVMHGDSSDLCPSYIVTAELDILRDEALAYVQKLEDDNIQVQSYTVLGAPHGFINLIGVHKGLKEKTRHSIDEFMTLVQTLIANEGNEPDLRA